MLFTGVHRVHLLCGHSLAYKEKDNRAYAKTAQYNQSNKKTLYAVLLVCTAQSEQSYEVCWKYYCIYHNYHNSLFYICRYKLPPKDDFVGIITFLFLSNLVAFMSHKSKCLTLLSHHNYNYLSTEEEEWMMFYRHQSTSNAGKWLRTHFVVYMWK